MKNEINLSFCIWDFDDISHDAITQILGVAPSKIYIKGERKNKKIPTIAKENAWLLNTTLGKYALFKDQMDSLLDILEPKVEILKPFCEKYYCEFSCALFIYKGNEESTPWIHLDKRYNQLIKELNIEFDIDLYCLSNDDES